MDRSLCWSIWEVAEFINIRWAVKPFLAGIPPHWLEEILKISRVGDVYAAIDLGPKSVCITRRKEPYPFTQNQFKIGSSLYEILVLRKIKFGINIPAVWISGCQKRRKYAIITDNSSCYWGIIAIKVMHNGSQVLGSKFRVKNEEGLKYPNPTKQNNHFPKYLSIWLQILDQAWRGSQFSCQFAPRMQKITLNSWFI